MFLLPPPTTAKLCLQALSAHHPPLKVEQAVLKCLLAAAQTQSTSCVSSLASQPPSHCTPAHTPEQASQLTSAPQQDPCRSPPWLPHGQQCHYSATVPPMPAPATTHLSAQRAPPAGMPALAQDRLSMLQPHTRKSHPITDKPHALSDITRGSCTLELYHLPGWAPPAPLRRRSGNISPPLLSVPEATQAACAATSAAPGSEQALLLESAIDIIARLRRENELAFISGGWVRDALLGGPSADIDIATSASVQTQVPICLHDYNTKQLSRGMARLTKPGLQFEVAQFRGPLRDASYGSAYLDACLRDFTINAIFFDPFTGNVLDFVGGVDDLKKKVLRMPPYGFSPHKSSDVFSSDAIRVLRAVRFAAGFGLSLDAGVTKREIMKNVHRCKFDEPDGNRGALNLGNRRLYKELHKLANTVYTSPLGPAAMPYGLALATELGVLQSMFPSIAKHPNDGHDLGYLTPSLVRRVQDALPMDSPIELRLATLVNLWDPETARGQLTGLLVSMRHQSRPGPQKLQWDTGPVEMALEFTQFLMGLFSPLTQSSGSPAPSDGHAQLAHINSQDKAAYIRLLVHKHAPAFEAAALAYLPGADEMGVPAATGRKQISSPRDFVASHFRLIRSKWGSDIEIHRASQRRMEEHRSALH